MREKGSVTETERKRRDCETRAASVGGEKKKVKHGPTGFNCQYKLSSGESCHRLLAEEWKETE